MKLKSLIACALFSAVSMQSSAAVYTFSVDVNSRVGEIPLQADETQAMSYPTLDVNDATKAGAYCWAYGKNSYGVDGRAATEANSLCPQLTPLHSIVRFSGVPKSYITINQKIPEQDQGGFRFHYYDGKTLDSTTTYYINADGVVDVPTYSRITMINKDDVTDGSLTFTYEVIGAYQ